jgi:hypothetical protein
MSGNGQCGNDGTTRLELSTLRVTALRERSSAVDHVTHKSRGKLQAELHQSTSFQDVSAPAGWAGVGSRGHLRLAKLYPER